MQGETCNTRVARHSPSIEYMSYDMVDHAQCKIPKRLFIFESDEAVTRVIIQDRSPKLTHVSRTHHVHLDW